MIKLGLMAAIVSVFGLFLILQGADHVPPFSASLERLAETETEGYCSGLAFWKNLSVPNERKSAAAECRSNHDPTEIDLPVVQKAFCEGIVKGGYAQGVNVCMTIVVSNRFWPTYDGGYTDSWSRKFPYPGDLILQPSSDSSGDSRTGDREGNLRGD